MSCLCGEAATGFGDVIIGPCILRHGHDERAHQDADGVQWEPLPTSAGLPPGEASTLEEWRDLAQRALRERESETERADRAEDAVRQLAEFARTLQRHILVLVPPQRPRPSLPRPHKETP